MRNSNLRQRSFSRFQFLIFNFGNLHIPLSTATRRRDGRPKNRDKLPSWEKDQFLLQNLQSGAGAHPVSYTMGNWGGGGGELAYFPGHKKLRRKADHTLRSNAEVTNEWSCNSTTTYAFMAYKR
jgi:hypothetical protein